MNRTSPQTRVTVWPQVKPRTAEAPRLPVHQINWRPPEDERREYRFDQLLDECSDDAADEWLRDGGLMCEALGESDAAYAALLAVLDHDQPEGLPGAVQTLRDALRAAVYDRLEVQNTARAMAVRRMREEAEEALEADLEALL